MGAGADPNLADEEGRTPLHLAAALNESPKVMAALLRAGASPKARDGRGRTPLWTAATRSDAHGVELLLGAGAPADEPDDSGVTPLLSACERRWSCASVRWAANWAGRWRRGLAPQIS